MFPKMCNAVYENVSVYGKRFNVNLKSACLPDHQEEN